MRLKSLGVFLAGMFINSCSCLAISDDPLQIFEKAWQTTKTKITPASVEAKYFNEESHQQLRSQLNANSSLEDVEDVLNPYLHSLPVSHTGFYTKYDLDYYFFKSMFEYNDVSKPAIFHMGAQFEKEYGRKYRIRAVLDGYPAERSHLLRGDLVESADNGAPFNPVMTFTDGLRHRLTILRNGKRFVVNIKPIYESFELSFLNATKNSVRIYHRNHKKIGYIHLWCGTATEFLTILTNTVQNEFRNVDRVVLDIRDGYGGAWYDYLDPFYADRSSYFKSVTTDKLGHVEASGPDSVDPHYYFNGPLAVIVNEGVRSGKEALAFQFKKTGRATLVGTKTPGYFSAGEISFAKDHFDYVVYTSVMQVTLDGVSVEMLGVPPDIEVNYPLNVTAPYDIQVSRAIEYMSK